MPPIKPEEVAALTRATAEVQHELALMARRLEAADGPLALLARKALATVEESYENAAESLRAAAPVLTLVESGA